MSDKPADKDKQHTIVNTGGGGYFAGNVNAGGDVVGRDYLKNSRNVEINRQGASVDELKSLLAELRQLLSQVELKSDTARIIEGDVRVVDEQAGKKDGDGGLIKNRLQSIRGLLSGAGDTAGSVDRIMSVVNKAIQMAHTLHI